MVEPWVLSADLGRKVLAIISDYLTKAVGAQEGTATVPAKGDLSVLDMAKDTFSIG